MFVEMSSKGLLFLNMESTVCAPDLLTPRISRGLARRGADAFAVTRCSGVPVSCVVSLGQVQEAGRGAGAGWHVGRHSWCKGQAQDFSSFFLQLTN